MGEVEVGEDARSFVGVKVGGETQNNNIPKAELKRDRQSLINDEAESNQSPTKKQAKEFSNDDVCSEVTNPIISPKANPSTFQDITSQPSELANGGSQAECGEVTSAASSRNSSFEETLSNEEPSAIEASQIDNDRSNGVLKSRIVLEIPELAASAGVRKITFKFSKRKEEYDTHSVTSGFDSISSYGGSCQVPGPYSSAMFDANVEIPEYCYQKGSGKTRKSLVCDPYMELKMSKKVVQANYPTNVKKLLATGILDGARVIYVCSSSEKQMNGIISGGGYLCGCSACNFTRVLSAYEFEHHAGFQTRHPNNHIYLENGRPIYSIIQELKTAPLSMLDEVFRDLVGSSVNEEHFQIWKASLQQNNEIAEVGNRHRPSVLRLPHPLVGCSSPSLEESISSASYSFAQNNFKREIYMETTEEQKRIMNRSNSYTSYSIVQHKKTAEGCTRRRDNDLHRLLFMPNGLPDGAELAYYVKGQRILGGRKQGNGIACNCCNREVSPSQFEAHAGMAARRQPYRHIYTTSGLTLHDIAISLANGQNYITGDSDDMCAVCGDGGDLILCHGCPRAFHAACLDLPWVPQHDWHCPNCKDRYGSGRKTATGESSNISRPIVIRLTRVVKAPEIEIGGCVVCRGHDFSSAKFDERTVMLCDQCEKEFHVGCLRESGLCDLKELPKDKWFCSDDCSRIHVALQNSVSVGVEIVPASSSCMILRKLVDKGLPLDGIAVDIQWRVLSGKSRYPEHLPYLSRSAAIFRECFDPIVAPSGRDLIPVMVYGRNISGQEFGGMYCVVLIVRSIVVSAGLLRIFGREVAELPLVATSREHQGKGYFQALFLCVERLLSSLNVENIVLPAAEEAESIWTNKFGFTKMSEERLSKYTREVQFTIFKGTSMLEKTVPRMVE